MSQRKQADAKDTVSACAAVFVRGQCHELVCSAWCVCTGTCVCVCVCVSTSCVCVCVCSCVRVWKEAERVAGGWSVSSCMVSHALRPPQLHTRRAQAHAHTHACTHARTHTHTLGCVLMGACRVHSVSHSLMPTTAIPPPHTTNMHTC